MRLALSKEQIEQAGDEMAAFMPTMAFARIQDVLDIWERDAIGTASMDARDLTLGIAGQNAGILQTIGSMRVIFKDIVAQGQKQKDERLGRK